MADIFGEDKTVGGAPFFAWTIQNCLPKSKKKRELIFRIQAVIVTYITYSMYNMARRPLAVVKTKIIAECNETNDSGNASDHQWCHDTIVSGSTEELMGLLDAVYLLIYGLCLFMSGIVADCYNPRYYLTAGCLLSGFCCSLLGLSDFWQIRSFKFFGTVLILFGATQSTGWPVVLSCVTHWYKGDKRALFFGFWNTHNYIGSILGSYIAGVYVDSGVWGWSFFIPGFILAFMGIFVFLYMVVDPADIKELEKQKSPMARRRLTQMEVPPWLSSTRSITMYDAVSLPGVIEFSLCMFFSRMVGYMFLFWLPTVISRTERISAQGAAYYSIAYVLGGSLGGIVAGILVDVFRRSAVVCGFFLLFSLPVLALGQISEFGRSNAVDFPVYMAMGLFVEAPYVVISTSVSADLGTHKMIKLNHRAISTIGGIVEGTGALGAAIGTYIFAVFMSGEGWTKALYLMMGLQLAANLCLSRQVYKDFMRTQERRTFTDYWKTPSPSG